jgi:hypothetical protein
MLKSKVNAEILRGLAPSGSTAPAASLLQQTEAAGRNGGGEGRPPPTVKSLFIDVYTKFLAECGDYATQVGWVALS